tara:strand:- start:2115 stop:3959 length:1845 start_codon:yes stop_codon:yes gene_type:complete
MANFLSGRKTKLDLGITSVTEADVTLDVIGIVTANQYNGNQVIGLPTIGNFRAGAYTPVATEFTKDSIDELNYILGKLVPDPPTDVDGITINLDYSTLPAVSNATTTVRGLCAGFTPVNNTGDAAPVAGNEYYMNHDNTITTDYETDYGPGDTGTFKAFVNNVGVGTTTLNVSFGLYAAGSNNGTYDSLVIANNTDASDSARNTGITSLFYEVFDFRVLDAPSPVGYNKVYFTHQTSSLKTTNPAYWYEDSGPVGAPVISFSGVTAPSSPTLSYSSGVPHYTQAAGNAFTYVVSVENATGDMYYRATGSSANKLLWADTGSQLTYFASAGTKNFNQFYASGTQGTHPPQRNFGVGTAVTCTVSHQPQDIHKTVDNTWNHFHRWDCWTPYGAHQNQRINYDKNVNLMGTTARTNEVDEDNIGITGTLGSGSGNATRVKAGATGDNPSPTYASWTGNAAGSIDTYEAVVRGADLRHDETDYSAAVWLPPGPDYSSGRNGAQYFQFQAIRSAVSEFNIVVTGTYGGCWVCMPDNSTWTTSLSATNGWASMQAAYVGSGVPRNSDPGCSSGGVMNGTSGTYKCVFGTESSTNDSNNRILIRFRLDSGDAISALTLAAT